MSHFFYYYYYIKYYYNNYMPLGNQEMKFAGISLENLVAHDANIHHRAFMNLTMKTFKNRINLNSQICHQRAFMNLCL